MPLVPFTLSVYVPGVAFRLTLIVRFEETGPDVFTFTVPCEKLALVCFGKPLTLNVVGLLEKPRSLKLIETVPLEPLRIGFGVKAPAEMLKSEAGTFSVKDTLWFFGLSVPVTVSVIVPAFAPEATDTVIVELVAESIEAGAKLQVIDPEQFDVRATEPTKPFNGTMLTVAEELLVLAKTVSDVCDRDRLKSGDVLPQPAIWCEPI